MRGMGLSPITAASAGDELSGFMNAAFGVRFAAFFALDFFLAPGFLAVDFFAVDFLLAGDFLAVDFFLAPVRAPPGERFSRSHSLVFRSCSSSALLKGWSPLRVAAFSVNSSTRSTPSLAISNLPLPARIFATRSLSSLPRLAKISA